MTPTEQDKELRKLQEFIKSCFGMEPKEDWYDSYRYDDRVRIRDFILADRNKQVEEVLQGNVQFTLLGDFPSAVPGHKNWVDVMGKVYQFDFTIALQSIQKIIERDVIGEDELDIPEGVLNNYWSYPSIRNRQRDESRQALTNALYGKGEVIERYQ